LFALVDLKVSQSESEMSVARKPIQRTVETPKSVRESGTINEKQRSGMSKPVFVPVVV
jgi:hypothetical protein